VSEPLDLRDDVQEVPQPHCECCRDLTDARNEITRLTERDRELLSHGVAGCVDRRIYDHEIALVREDAARCACPHGFPCEIAALRERLAVMKRAVRMAIDECCNAHYSDGADGLKCEMDKYERDLLKRAADAHN